MDATTGAQKQHGENKNRPGKPIICFHCGGNHPVFECDDLPLEEREKITMKKNTEWVKTMSARQSVQVTGKQKVDGHAHMQVSVEVIDGHP